MVGSSGYDIRQRFDIGRKLAEPVARHPAYTLITLSSHPGCTLSQVGDFGLSRVSDTTKTMTICGSPLWTAPEMLMSVRYNEKVDIYSFGVILWETHQWDEPYPGMMVFEIVKGVVDEGERPEIKPSMHKDLASSESDASAAAVVL